MRKNKKILMWEVLPTIALHWPIATLLIENLASGKYEESYKTRQPPS